MPKDTKHVDELTDVGRKREAISGGYDGVLSATALVGLLAVSELTHVETDVAPTFGTQRTLTAVEMILYGDSLTNEQRRRRRHPLDAR
jgi:hypothetical protein